MMKTNALTVAGAMEIKAKCRASVEAQWYNYDDQVKRTSSFDRRGREFKCEARDLAQFVEFLLTGFVKPHARSAGIPGFPWEAHEEL